MLRKFNAFHRNIKGGCVFVSGVLPPPLDHLDCFRLSLCPRWRTEELEAKLTVDVQHTIRTDKLNDENVKLVLKRTNFLSKLFFINDQTRQSTLRNAHAIFLNPPSCLLTSTFALASSMVMKSRILTKHLNKNSYWQLHWNWPNMSKCTVSYFKEE